MSFKHNEKCFENVHVLNVPKGAKVTENRNFVWTIATCFQNRSRG